MAPASRVRIITCPPGEAPLSVRLAWVGLELPVTPTSRKLAMTSGVLSAPRDWWQRIAALFTGSYGVRTGYAGFKLLAGDYRAARRQMEWIEAHLPSEPRFLNDP